VLPLPSARKSFAVFGMVSVTQVSQYLRIS